MPKTALRWRRLEEATEIRIFETVKEANEAFETLVDEIEETDILFDRWRESSDGSRSYYDDENEWLGKIDTFTVPV